MLAHLITKDGIDVKWSDEWDDHYEEIMLGEVIDNGKKEVPFQLATVSCTPALVAGEEYHLHWFHELLNEPLVFHRLNQSREQVQLEQQVL